jgi:uncharacterized protein YigA (DUF484 family)
MNITDADVAEFLRQTPDFFLHYPSLLGQLKLPDPATGKALSLHERQVQVLREKQKLMESRIVEMGRAATENQAIIQKLQAWQRTLLKEKNPAAIPAIIEEELGRLFAIPLVCLRLWPSGNSAIHESYILDADEFDRRTIDDLKIPYCGPSSGTRLDTWLKGRPAHASSVALIPVRIGFSPKALGLLVLGSPDPGRFSADAGVEFLVNISEIASASLSRIAS